MVASVSSPSPKGTGTRHPGIRPGLDALPCLRQPGLVALDRGGYGYTYALQGRIAEGRAPVFACHLERWGLRPWHRLLLAGTLTGVLVLLSREAAVVWLLLVSYPVLLMVARRRIASLAVDRGAAWRTAHAVVGCLGVGGLLMATGPPAEPGYTPKCAARDGVGDPGVSVSPPTPCPRAAPPWAADGRVRRVA